MTDPAEPPVPDDVTDARQRARRRSDVQRAERALRHGALALLVAIIALGTALFASWRTYEATSALDARLGASPAARDPQQADAALARGSDSASSEALSRLAPLSARVDQIDARLGRAEAHLEAPERAVARVEAAHLTELAARRLALDHDVSGAIVLFEAADARLAAQHDPEALRIRAQLTHDLASLRAVSLPDLHAIGGRLGAAESSVHDLPMLGAIRAQYVPPGGAPTPASGASRAWHQFTTSLSDLVSVRRVSDASVRLVSIEEIGVRRRHLQTLLFAARLAALRGDQVEYAADLGEASDWLARYFDVHDARTAAVAAELSALATSRVASDLPDVSGSLRALRGSRP